MLEAIVSLGKMQYSSDPNQLIRGLVRKIWLNPKEPNYYLTLDFSTKSQNITLSIAELSTNIVEKLNYVGIVPASGLQFHTTGHDLKHLCSQVLPALRDKLHDSSLLKIKITSILSDYFALDHELKPNNRYRYLLDVEGLGMAEPGMISTLFQTTKDNKRPGIVAKAILEHLKKRDQIDPSQIRLFVISIDGDPISLYEDYIQVVLNDQVSMFDEAQDGVCYITGKTTKVSANLTKFRFKYYITDKLNFSRNFSRRFNYNFQLSEEAAWYMLLGERYIINHLRTRIGNFNVYLIPEYFDQENKSFHRKQKAILRVMEQIEDLSKLKELQRVEQRMMEGQEIDELRGIETHMLLNFLFYEDNKNEMKVHRHIKDVPPSRITRMQEQSENVFGRFKTIAPHFSFYGVTLESLFYLIPLEVDGMGKVKNPQHLMQLYDGIFSGRKLNRKEIIFDFVSLLSRVRHNTFGGLQVGYRWKVSNEQQIERLWVRLTFEQNQFLSWLEAIESLEKEESSMIELREELAEEQDHLNASGFNTAKAAMFLLGCAIKKIADAQYKELNSKPILRKINFRGMTPDAISRLVLDVYEKGLQYQSVIYQNWKFELYVSSMKGLLDQIDQNLKLSESEAVFYILSGYSFLVGREMKPRNAPTNESPEPDHEDQIVEQLTID